jgi:hypothetical protein
MTVNTEQIARSMRDLMSELVLGAPEGGAYVLNPGDRGLLESLDRLSADAASVPATGGASISAHVRHLRYGLSLMNRWAAGENPFEDADWAATWDEQAVTEEEWARLRRELRREAEQWIDTLSTPREVSEVELNGMIGSIAHLAYHLGAIRQIDRTIRGPGAND